MHGILIKITGATMNVYNPRFPVYIISKGRSDRCKTSKLFDRLGIDYTVVVEQQEYELYRKTIKGKVVSLPQKYKEDYDTFWHDGDTRTGPGAARNFCWDDSIKNGYGWHWVCDDNIESIERFNNNLKIPCTNGKPLYCMEDFVLRFKNIAIAGPQYSIFQPATERRSPLRFNTRIYSFLLIRNDIPYRWRGRYNEDTDLCLRALKDGWVTCEFNCFLQGKRATQTVKGGNNAEFYEKEGTYNKSKMLVDMHPDVTRMVYRWNRWHHLVDYSVFKQLPVYRDDYVRTEKINAFSMKIIKKTP